MHRWWVVSGAISIFPRVDFSASRGELVITNKYKPHGTECRGFQTIFFISAGVRGRVNYYLISAHKTREKEKLSNEAYIHTP
jgi:hypothetical protein